MTPEQIAQAQRLAREWDTAHPREPKCFTLNRLSAEGRIGVYIGSDMSELEREARRAMEDLRARAEAGDADAQSTLGSRFANGHDVKKDEAEAVMWYARATAQGDKFATYNLSLAADQGMGGSRLYLEALEGGADAKLKVAVALRDGLGVRQDAAEAFRWLRFAAEQGYAEAQFVLGDAYKNSHDVPQDDAEAVRWIRLAAEQGHFGAQVDLARSYLEGFGVPQDYELAHIWANLAVGNAPRNFREGCSKLRDQAAEHFSPSKIIELQKRAREWVRPTSDDARTPQTPKKTLQGGMYLGVFGKWEK
jgi:TPR repeat protein